MPGTVGPPPTKACQANFSSAPFQYRQLKNPNIKRLLSSNDLFADDPMSFNVVGATSKFRSENPKLFAAFVAAMKEATDVINADKRRTRQLLEAALDRGADNSQPPHRLQHLRRRRLSGTPELQQLVLQEIDQMQAQPQRRPRREGVYKGSVAPIGGECRRRENARDIGDISRGTVQVTPACLDPANRAGQKTVGDPGDWDNT